MVCCAAIGKGGRGWGREDQGGGGLLERHLESGRVKWMDMTAEAIGGALEVTTVDSVEILGKQTGIRGGSNKGGRERGRQYHSGTRRFAERNSQIRSDSKTARAPALPNWTKNRSCLP